LNICKIDKKNFNNFAFYDKQKKRIGKTKEGLTAFLNLRCKVAGQLSCDDDHIKASFSDKGRCKRAQQSLMCLDISGVAWKNQKRLNRLLTKNFPRL